MAGRNAVNKPKSKIASQRHAASIGKRRASRMKNRTATKSSSSRYSESTAPAPTQSTALALYKGDILKPSGGFTTTTLSKKRALKIARNQRYVEKRNEKMVISLVAQKENEMELDGNVDAKNKNSGTSSLNKTKAALWSVVEDRASEGIKLSLDGEGTTLGIQAF